MTIPARKQALDELQEKLGASFLDTGILDQALTHSSFGNELLRQDIKNNERLEFLGDAVLKLVISDHLFRNFPDLAEGDLTKIRAAVVSDLALSEISKKLGIGKYLLLGKNERASGGELKKSNLANALESSIAALYLDRGLESAAEVVIRLLKEQITKASAKDFIIDYKSALQELCQKNKWGLPFYQVTKELGPKHKKIFWIAVKIKGKKCGSGRGRTKKEAEQHAAKEALQKFNETEEAREEKA